MMSGWWLVVSEELPGDFPAFSAVTLWSALISLAWIRKFKGGPRSGRLNLARPFKAGIGQQYTNPVAPGTFEKGKRR